MIGLTVKNIIITKQLKFFFKVPGVLFCTIFGLSQCGLAGLLMCPLKPRLRIRFHRIRSLCLYLMNCPDEMVMEDRIDSAWNLMYNERGVSMTFEVQTLHSTVIFWTEPICWCKKLPKQVYVAPKLKSSLQKFYGHYHDLVDRYEISIPQMTMDLLSFLYQRQDFYRTLINRKDEYNR
jgi:hypothetical protein